MPTVLATQSTDPMLQLCDQFRFITREAAEDFVKKVISWYEWALELLPENKVPVLNQETFFETQMNEETLEFINRCFYDKSLDVLNKKADEMSEEDWEDVDQAMLDQHGDLEDQLLMDIRVVLDFYNMSYAFHDYIDVRSSWQARKYIANEAIVEVW